MTQAHTRLSWEELLLDDDFLAYALEGRAAGEWTTLMANDSAFAARVSQAQKAVFELRNASISEQDKEPLNEAADRVWTRIAASTAASSTSEQPQLAKEISLLGREPTQRRGRIRRLSLAVAAVAAAIFLAVMFWPTTLEQYRSGPGELLTVTLPDGSRAVLSPGSELTVEDYDDVRTLSLRGEAFFEVERGQPFTVQTERGQVRVLGTSFNVDASARLNVACATGRVSVETDSESLVLTPGQAAREVSAGGLESLTVLVRGVGAWRSGVVRLADESLADLGTKLERYYGRPVDIAVSNRQRRVTVDLPLRDFPAAIERLGFVLQTPIDTLDGRIRIQ